MARFGFNGGSYTSLSPNVAANRAINWYCESVEDPSGKTAIAMYPSPGLAIFASGLSGPPRGGFQFNGRAFAVAGSNLYEFFSSAPPINRGMVSRDANPVYFAGGPDQILFCSAGVAYVFTLSTNALAPVNAVQLQPLPVARVAYVDGFFVILYANSGKFQYSSPDDATTWDLLNTAIVSVYPDNVVGMVVNYRELIFFGNKQSQAYYDSGNIFTFDVDTSGFIEQGCGAGDSITKLDNAIFFIEGSDRGQGIAYRLNGFAPQRVSNHAVETAWAKYPKISDAIGYAFEDQGHNFWHIYFPSANASWRYDVATGLWHEVGFWNGQAFDAHRSRCHFFAFGQHLVGDWKTGTIYSMSINNVQDFGNPIVRERRAPHVSSEQEWIFHNSLQLDLETGLGPMPPLLDGQGNPRDPQVILDWSDDGGHTWKEPRILNCGQAGKFRTRVIARRLGKSRDRIYRLRCSDPVPFRIVDAYLDASPGFDKPTERYASQIRKVA